MLLKGKWLTADLIFFVIYLLYELYFSKFKFSIVSRFYSVMRFLLVLIFYGSTVLKHISLVMSYFGWLPRTVFFIVQIVNVAFLQIKLYVYDSHSY